MPLWLTHIPQPPAAMAALPITQLEQSPPWPSSPLSGLTQKAGLRPWPEQPPTLVNSLLLEPRILQVRYDGLHSCFSPLSPLLSPPFLPPQLWLSVTAVMERNGSRNDLQDGYHTHGGVQNTLNILLHIISPTTYTLFYSSSSQMWPQNSFTLLKITEEPKDFLLTSIISDENYHIRN